MKLRTLLFLLMLVILIPVSTFGIGTALFAVKRERQAFVQSAVERTSALTTAVDTEIARHTSSLVTLASSTSLLSSNLHEFHDEMIRLMPNQRNWIKVILALPSGQTVLSTEDFDETVVHHGVEGCRTTEPGKEKNVATIGNISKTDGDWTLAICVPVQFENETLVLAAYVDPGTFLTLLTPQRLRPGWVAVILDSNDNVVARTANNDRYLGRPASSSLRDAVMDRGEGWFTGHLIEGNNVYTSYKHSPTSLWTVAIGVPADEFEAIGRGSLVILAVGLPFAISIALVLAGVVSRRITRPMQSLAIVAKAIGNGETVTTPVSQGVAEAQEVSRALFASAQAVIEREEKLRAADTAKNEFLAMLGHELRNPLSALTSAAQVLRTTEDDEPGVLDAVGIVRRQISRMTRLVDDLLDVSRVTSAKIRLEHRDIRLDSVVQNVYGSMDELLKFGGLEVSLELNPVWINGDEMRIEQVIFNLLENAAKYTPEGGRIEVRLVRANDKAILEVEDTGIGLSEALIQRVFDLFAQGHRSIDRSIGGLGIGLTMVKTLTELHGGTVSVCSEGVDQGARFAVTLPAIDPPASLPVSVINETPIQPHRKVLLIEDNDDARVALAALLRHYGYETSEAVDGLEGISVAEDQRPEVAIIDIGLPKCDGYEVAKRLRLGPLGDSILLIALTGYGGDATRKKVAEAGFDHYLIKPVSPPALAALIESLLSAG